MRALSFLFAALLGIALAMIAPVLAAPRPEAPQPAVMAAAITPESVGDVALEPAAEPAAEIALEPADAASGDALSLEQISRSILDAIGSDGDVA